MNPKSKDLEKKLRGYLYGSACADALGRPVEMLDIGQIKEKYGEKGILELPSAALWTDDTQLMLVLARSLLRGAELELPKLMDIFAEELVQWLDEPDLGAGATSKGAALHLKAGIGWEKSGIASKTCGSLMRVGILGFIYQNNPEKLVRAASLSGKITHIHPTADAASIAGAYSVKLAFDGVKPGDMLEPLLKVTEGISEEFTEALTNSYNLASGNMEDKEALGKIGQGWSAEETFAMAYFCMLRYSENYKKAIQTAVNITGDSDSIGSVAGGILGARLGIDAIPATWIKALEGKQELEAMVTPLLRKYLEIS